MLRLRSVGVALSALAVFATACTGESPSGSAARSFAVTRSDVEVTLQDFAITLDAYAVVAGEVTFHITNVGSPMSTVQSRHVHEFVVLKTDLAGDSLPTGPDGSVDEEADGLEVIARVDPMRVGESQDLTLSLDAGDYIVVCNVIENGMAHYPLEFGIPFTVM
jgi:hypothetical protein